MTKADPPLRLPDHLRAPLGVLWGKSKADGRVNLLIQHLLDTGAAAEHIWDHYLAPALRWRLDELCRGRGRAFFTWLCAVHDVGKATPAFQSQAPELARAVQDSGLRFGKLPPHANRQWRHDPAGGKIIRDALRRAGWSKDTTAWVWPLIAGHHGAFPGQAVLNSRQAEGRLHGNDERWDAVQAGLVDIVTAAAGFDSLPQAEPDGLPSRADQLALSGSIVMADWIASNESHFAGIDMLDDVGMDVARKRAARAWAALGLRGGWGERLPVPDGDVVRRRFELPARPSQALVVEMARSMPAPGLLIIEAPMGEGKTEAALAAAEIFAARFGADGVFVGMPTQATSDPMYSRVRTWSRGIQDGLPVALLHGKRMFNPEWRTLVEASRPQRACTGEDEYGVPFSNIDEGGDHERSGGDDAPAEWFLGPKRGLLAPFVVGTIDQLLYGATRTRHVMLRYAGLAGKIVVLDEIHAADVYMLQFVDEGLRWLGQGGVPVILLSATLAPDQRRQLVASYVQGALGDPHVIADDLPRAEGYPSVTTTWVDEGAAYHHVASTSSWREPQRVAVEVLDERPDDPITSVTDLVLRELGSGGCALVIRNTVGRAQQTYAALRAELGEDLVLLHARLSAGHRADRTERVLSLLRPPDGSTDRPDRLVVVATQLAEQSFDVDVDLLVSDLAPIDLLLQRVGRLHRHARPESDRPPGLRRPRAVVTGLGLREDTPPWLPGGSLAVYPEYHLLRTAALVVEAARDGGWSIPDDVPDLVAAAYGEETLVPAGWLDRETKARQRLRQDDEQRIGKAEPFLLVRKGERSKQTLEGLHHGHSRGVATEDELRAVVRDGDPSVEVVLVRRDCQGYRTLDRTWLGANAEAGADHLMEVLAGTVRLPAALTGEAEQLLTLPEWRDRPWLKFCRVLVLDTDGCGQVGEHLVRYDDQLGLLTQGHATGPLALPREAGTK